MKYVISDIHGCVDEFMEILSLIHFREEDWLFVVGDVIDRGPDPVKCLEFAYKTPNVVLLKGNHELMFQESTELLDGRLVFLRDSTGFFNWAGFNGGSITKRQFRRLSPVWQSRLYRFVCGLPTDVEVSAGEADYLLVHAGLGSGPVEEALISQIPETEKLWTRADPERLYFAHKSVVLGHTPTPQVARQLLMGREIRGGGGEIADSPEAEEEKARNGQILRGMEGKMVFWKNKIFIDCGCVFGFRLGCLCLDTMEEFYVASRQRRR